MTNDEIFELFNAIPEPYRMLCIDAAFTGCWLVQQPGKEKAGRKLLSTTIKAAGLGPEITEKIIKNLPESANSLAAHAEMRSLK